MATKQCSACLKIYELSRKNFPRDSSRSSGFGCKCKDCTNKKMKSARQRLAREEGKRQCPICKEVLPLSSVYFHRDKNKLMGFSNLCKICKSIKQKENEKNRTLENQYGKLNEKTHYGLKGFVYILESNGVYKIGATSNKFTLIERIKKLQCGNPYEIKIKHLIGAADMMEAEARLHEKYKLQHIRGERFDLNDDQIKHLMTFDSIKTISKL